MKKGLILGLLTAVICLTGCVKPAEVTKTDTKASAAGIYQQRVEACVKKIRETTDFVPETVIVLGTGFGDAANHFEKIAEVEYSSLPDFPVCTVEGHEGKFVFGRLSGKNVVFMQGTIHYYEGYEASEVVMPLRVLRQLGANKVILTNAAGSLRDDIKVGDFVLIRDQLTFLVPSPLRGPEAVSYGERFIDSADMYDREFGDFVLETAEKLGIPFKEGVYIQAPGPQFKTGAEAEAFISWGADVSGMSTGMEAIAAKQMGMKICGISYITAPKPGSEAVTQEVTHEEVMAESGGSSEKLELLIKTILEKF